MAPHRIKIAFTCLLAACLVPDAWGCGGWDEEEPVTLDATLACLPAKSIGEIFGETSPASPGVAAPSIEEIEKIIARVGKDKPDDLAKEVDGLLTRARADYKNGDLCNLLQDVRDVVTASSADAPAAQAYLKWRIEHRTWFGFPPEPDPQRPYEEKPPRKPEEITVQKAELERLADGATGPIKAHWLYLRGAYLFSDGDRKECREWFEQVVKEFPDHPRTEFASFLLARCDLVASRQDALSDEDRPKAHQKAVEAFQLHQRKYPEGRLEGDVAGWLGALAYDMGDYLPALQYYIAQAEDVRHPEIFESAVIMCEKTLEHLDPDADNEAVYALIARHPQVAMGYIYQVLNASEENNFDGQIDESAKVRAWRRKVLPLIAAQVAKQHDLYKSDDWKPRYLAMLAQAAGAAGDQAQALQITGVAADEMNKSDDLLFARALALQRAKRPAEAIEVYRTMLKHFPNGPLSDGARLRLALALQDNHQAGEAIAELRAVREKQTNPGPDYAYEDQTWQAIDTMLNFAPLPELASTLDNAAFDGAAKAEMRSVIAERCLVAENFAEAKKYMTPAQFGLLAANLEKLSRAAAAAHSGKERAAKYAELGDAWARARGMLLHIPLSGGRGPGALAGKGDNFMGPLESQYRRENARALGLTDYDRELEDRDELRHASRWWMRAAREDPGSPLAAKTRWKALEAMPVIASESEYAEMRALEIHTGQVSREIYDKLRSECPGSIEAKRYAVYWSFPGPQKDEQGNIIKVWDTYRYGEEAEERDLNLMGYTVSDYGAFDAEPHDPVQQEGAGDDWKKITPRIAALREHAGQWSVARMEAELSDLAKQARKQCGAIEEVTVLNFLDDMTLFAGEKGVTPGMLQAYLDIRLQVLGSSSWPDSPMHEAIKMDEDNDIGAKIDAAFADPAMKPVADYLACARIGLVAATQVQLETSVTTDKDGAEDPITQPSRDFKKIEGLCRDFLKKYPRSRKREAVMFVLARSVQSLSKPHVIYSWKPLPGTKIEDERGRSTQVNFRVEPFSAKRVLEALDAYDREFPKGRYAADIRDYRAYVAWQMHDWGSALDLTLAEMEDDSQPILRHEAQLRLADMFALLAKSEYRADLLEAIRQRPAAGEKLKLYLTAAPKNTGHPLRYLQDYLTDQLALAGK